MKELKKHEYDYYNAEPVLNRLETMISEGNSKEIQLIYDDLSIFDWWPEKLNIRHMKQMRTFLKEAIKLGFKGYVSFKVGASGCGNGMWAYKVPTTTGFAPYPRGESLYRSFTPDYTYYSFTDKDGRWFPCDRDFNSLKTTKMLEQAMQEAGLI